MPKRLSTKARQEILRRAALGLTDAEIGMQVGCSRTTVARVRRRGLAVDRTTKGRVLQVRLSLREAEAFEALVAEAGMTNSGMLRHLIRMSAGVIAFRSDEVETLRTSGNQLNALARNLVQMLKLARAGKLRWNARDVALVVRLTDRTEEVASAVDALRAASLRAAFVEVKDIPRIDEDAHHG